MPGRCRPGQCLQWSLPGSRWRASWQCTSHNPSPTKAGSNETAPALHLTLPGEQAPPSAPAVCPRIRSARGQRPGCAGSSGKKSGRRAKPDLISVKFAKSFSCSCQCQPSAALDSAAKSAREPAHAKTRTGQGPGLLCVRLPNQSHRQGILRCRKSKGQRGNQSALAVCQTTFQPIFNRLERWKSNIACF